jgi:release factor glutamine methyltransferase
VLDLGTGSGAIALALKAERPHCQVWATDISPAALRVAQENAQRLGLDVTFSCRDWFEGLGDRRFDLIVSNPPYIDAHDPHLANLHAEPRSALTPGLDGLRDLRTLISTAGPHLMPGAWLLLEHGWDQAQAVCQDLTRAGFEQVTTRRDLSGQHRCSGGRWRGAEPAP